MIYPKKSKMLQLDGNSGASQMNIRGGERIFSKADSKRIVSLAKEAKNDKALLELGKFVYEATRRQDLSSKEYT